MRLTLLALALIGSLAAVISTDALRAAAPPANDKVLRHVVMYKFKETATPQQVQEVIDTFSALPSKIDTIVGYECGTNVSTEGKSEGLTHIFVVSFKDEAGRDKYLTHPAHLEYVNVAKDRREKAVVIDYWTPAPKN